MLATGMRRARESVVLGSCDPASRVSMDQLKRSARSSRQLGFVRGQLWLYHVQSLVAVDNIKKW